MYTSIWRRVIPRHFLEIYRNFQKDLEIFIARKLHLFANKCKNIFPFSIRKVGNRMITTVYSRLSLIGTLLIGTIFLSEPILKSNNRISIQIYNCYRNPRFIGTKMTGPEGFGLTRGYCIINSII